MDPRQVRRFSLPLHLPNLPTPRIAIPPPLRCVGVLPRGVPTPLAPLSKANVFDRLYVGYGGPDMKWRRRRGHLEEAPDDRRPMTDDPWPKTVDDRLSTTYDARPTDDGRPTTRSTMTDVRRPKTIDDRRPAIDDRGRMDDGRPTIDDRTIDDRAPSTADARRRVVNGRRPHGRLSEAPPPGVDRRPTTIDDRRPTVAGIGIVSALVLRHSDYMISCTFFWSSHQMLMHIFCRLSLALAGPPRWAGYLSVNFPQCWQGAHGVRGQWQECDLVLWDFPGLSSSALLSWPTNRTNKKRTTAVSMAGMGGRPPQSTTQAQSPKVCAAHTVAGRRPPYSGRTIADRVHMASTHNMMNLSIRHARSTFLTHKSPYRAGSTPSTDQQEVG